MVTSASKGKNKKSYTEQLGTNLPIKDVPSIND